MGLYKGAQGHGQKIIEYTNEIIFILECCYQLCKHYSFSLFIGLFFEKPISIIVLGGRIFQEKSKRQSRLIERQ
jgi:hypothetical protein